MAKVVFINGGGPKVQQIFEQLAVKGLAAQCLDQSASNEEKKAALAGAEYLVLHPAQLDDALLAAAPKLKLIQLLTAGYDKMNLGLCRERQIAVATNGGANAASVAEHSVALLLAIYRRLKDGDAAVRAGAWRKPIQEFTTFEIAGKTVGVLGAGNIGRRAAQLYKAFGADILYYDRQASDFMEQELGAKKAELGEIVSRAEVLSVHLPLFAETRNLLGAQEFARMKPELVLINTSRAEVIEEKALLAALREKRLRAAGLDVFYEEPVRPDNPFLGLENVLLSPHVAGHSAEGWERRCALAWENIKRMEQGQLPKALVRS